MARHLSHFQNSDCISKLENILNTMLEHLIEKNMEKIDKLLTQKGIEGEDGSEKLQRVLSMDDSKFS